MLSSPRVLMACFVGALGVPLPAFAQEEGAEAPTKQSDILITAERVRGSAVGDTQPVAVLDEAALRALGVTSVKAMFERLQSMAAGADGSPPVLLLNGRRISGFGELQSMPPEAIERTEILSERDAARYGFPPTVRVMNFITKKHFRGAVAQELAGTTTEGRGGTNYAEVAVAKIDGPRRATLSISHFRQEPVRQSDRAIIPDSDALYATSGNVAGVGGASIDPALDALAGRPVTVAAVPSDPAARRDLAGYLAGANAPAVTDIGRYRTLQQRNEILRIDGTIASPVTKTIDGSLNLSLEAQRSAGTNGLAGAALTVPGSSDALPFTTDTLLYRYFPDAVLRQESDSLNLHASGTIQGSLRRWAWNVTSSYDRLHATARSDTGVPTDALQAAIDAGGDPLAALDPASAALRLRNHSDTVTGTLVAKAVANGPLVKLPAGDAQLTMSADYARSASSGRQPGALASTTATGLDLTRTTTGASVNIDVPIASANQGVLGFMGLLSANGNVGVSDVSNYGRLANSGVGLTWTPLRPLQFSASLTQSEAPPAIALLTSPTSAYPNTPFFDFTTGTSALVTTITGGNPALLPERRRVTSVGVALSPIKGKELRFSVDYVDTRIDNQSLTLGSVTPAIQAAFPDLFERAPGGQLTSVDLRPVNVAHERDRQLRFGFNLFTQLGRPDPPQPTPADPAAAATSGPPPRKPRQRPNLYTSITATYRLDDVLTLRPGLPRLDLLDGATLSGTGGRPRWETELNLGGSLGPFNGGIYARLQGPTRVRSDLAASDLHFSGRTWIVNYYSLDIGQLTSRPWAKKLSVQFTVENLLNDRIDVRDRNGATPSRYQGAYLDPIGRSVRLGLRKSF